MITFYSTNCPKCKVLAMKLDKAGIQYNVNTDIEAMVAKGIKSAPCLEIEDGQILDFSKAIAWLRTIDS